MDLFNPPAAAPVCGAAEGAFPIGQSPPLESAVPTGPSRDGIGL